MLPDRVSNPGPLTYESGVLPIALRSPAKTKRKEKCEYYTVILQLHTNKSLLIFQNFDFLYVVCDLKSLCCT